MSTRRLRLLTRVSAKFGKGASERRNHMEYPNPSGVKKASGT
jgi:hypothetical protein